VEYRNRWDRGKIIGSTLLSSRNRIYNSKWFQVFAFSIRFLLRKRKEKALKYVMSNAKNPMFFSDGASFILKIPSVNS